MTEDDFYAECARILNTEALGVKFPHYKRTRWNNRKAGRGRFAGRGIIRCFGDRVQIALSNPVLQKNVDSKEEALEVLRNICPT